jgi:hypothetical protein
MSITSREPARGGPTTAPPPTQQRACGTQWHGDVAWAANERTGGDRRRGGAPRASGGRARAYRRGSSRRGQALSHHSPCVASALATAAWGSGSATGTVCGGIVRGVVRCTLQPCIEELSTFVASPELNSDTLNAGRRVVAAGRGGVEALECGARRPRLGAAPAPRGAPQVHPHADAGQRRRPRAAGGVRTRCTTGHGHPTRAVAPGTTNARKRSCR